MSNEMSDQPAIYKKRHTSLRTKLVATAVIVVVIIVAVFLLYDYFNASDEAVIYDQALTPETIELLELQQANDSLLNVSELLDTVHGIYRIPIERAMELLAAESAGATPDQ